jgi:subtilisin family serine protease
MKHLFARLALVLASGLCAPSLVGAQALQPQWHHLDPSADHVMGISTERAYALLRQLGRRPSPRPVLVAVIDGGIDTAHADLRRVLWHNPQEVPGNGQDDEHDGYVDDVYGWNFLGGADGRNVFFTQKEETRIYARLRPRFAGKTLASLPPSEHAAFRLYEQARHRYTSERAKAEARYQADTRQLQADEANVTRLRQGLGLAVLDSATLHHPPTTDTALVRLASLYYPDLRGRLATTDSLFSRYRAYNQELHRQLDYQYNLAYDPTPLVGDHPTDLAERHYGNPRVQAGLHDHGTQHGTHCAGLIGADRTNGLGVQGVADHVRILSVRAIPGGDERDKDVANAIRYAVDQGAQIISMSFGKYLSPDKAVVDEAIRYAARKGVLLVHAAGNDRLDIDSIPQYPTGRYLNGRLIPNLLTVGASARTNDAHLVASFSNYGRQTVDVFAPGVELVSTWPGNEYRPDSGTSMATPVVAGMAAVLKTYFPQLTPADLKRLLLASAVPCHTQVRRPGSQQLVEFATLSRTGGVVNLYQAVRLASAEAAARAAHR